MLKGIIKENGQTVSIEGYDYQSYFDILFYAEGGSKILTTELLGDGIDTLESALEFTGSVRAILKESSIQFAHSKDVPINYEFFGRVLKSLNKLKTQLINENDVLFDDVNFMDLPFDREREFKTEWGTVKTKLSEIKEIKATVDGIEFNIVSTEYFRNFGFIGEKYTKQFKGAVVREKVEKPDYYFSGNSLLTLEEIIAMHPDRSYDYIMSKKVHLVTKDEIPALVERLRATDTPIGFDTETTGLDITFKKDSDYLVGMVFAIDTEEGFYIPLRHNKIDNVCEWDEVGYFLEENFKDILETKKLVFHNASFDWKVMYKEGIDCNLFYDTYIAIRLSIWNNARIPLNLKSLVKRFVGHDSLEFADLFGGTVPKDVSFADLEGDVIKYYACLDPINTLLLREYIEKQNFLSFYGADTVFKIEMEFAKAVGYQEYYGHRIAMERIPEIEENVRVNKERLYNKMLELTGLSDFNPASPNQLREILFGKFGLKPFKKTDKGSPSTDEDSLVFFSKTNEFAKVLLEYREYQGIESKLLKMVKSDASADGFLFSEVNQFLETGRVSVSKPNYQSYNKPVKENIVPRDGYYMLDWDQNSAEYRIMACMANEESLVNEFWNFDTDIHSFQASRMFSVPLLHVNKKLRQQSKGVSFGLMYGMQPRALGESIFGAVSEENTRKAEALVEKFFNPQPRLREFFRKAQEDSWNMGYATTYFGRRRYMDKTLKAKHKIQREGANHRIQGTAADIFKIAINRLMRVIKDNGWYGKVLIPAFVHDEALMEIHKSIDPAMFLKVLIKEIRLVLKGWAPLTNEFGWGRSWEEAKSTEITAILQDHIIDNYGDKGFDWWTGDLDQLCNFQVQAKKEYAAQRIISYFKDSSNYNKELYVPIAKLSQTLLFDLKNDPNCLDGYWDIDKDLASKLEFSDDPMVNVRRVCAVLRISDLFTQSNVENLVQKVETTEDNSVPTEMNINLEVDDSSFVKVNGYYKNSELKTFTVLHPKHILNTPEFEVSFMNKIQSVATDFADDEGFTISLLMDNDYYDSPFKISKKGVVALSKYLMGVKSIMS